MVKIKRPGKPPPPRYKEAPNNNFVGRLSRAVPTALESRPTLGSCCSAPPKFGDLVSFPFGSGWVTGRVVEDRGGLGVGGRRLYEIKFEKSPGEEVYTEVAEVYLTAGATAC